MALFNFESVCWLLIITAGNLFLNRLPLLNMSNGNKKNYLTHRISTICTNKIRITGSVILHTTFVDDKTHFVHSQENASLMIWRNILVFVLYDRLTSDHAHSRVHGAISIAVMWPTAAPLSCRDWWRDPRTTRQLRVRFNVVCRPVYLPNWAGTSAYSLEFAVECEGPVPWTSHFAPLRVNSLQGESLQLWLV
jgi:hypothetical protein